jgi:hypothetical protein
MAASRIPAVWLKVAAVFADALPDPAAQEVVVGEQPPGDDIRQRVYVAYGGDLGDLTMVRFTRTWSRAVGKRTQDEPFEVPCCVVCWSGDDDLTDADDNQIPDAFAELLDQTFALYDAVVAPLQADPGMGQGPPGPFRVEAWSGSVVPSPDRLMVRLPFTLQFFGRV